MSPAFSSLSASCNDGVVLEAHARREGADGGAAVGREAFAREEELMLLRLEPGGARGLLAEAEEQADLEAELCEGAVVGEGGAGHGGSFFRSS